MKNSPQTIIKTILKNQKDGGHWIIDQIKLNLDSIHIKDCSKGCDNNVYLISLENGSDDDKVIIRIPRHLKSEDCPIMHTPLMQSTILNVLTDAELELIDIQIPKLISLDTKNDQYMIESYIPECDLSEIFSIPSEMNDDQIKRVFSKVGEILYRVHSVKTTKFGSLQNTKLEGAFDNWRDFFEPCIIEQFESIQIDLDYIQKTHQEFQSTNEIRHFLTNFYNQDIKQTLTEFNKPCLVHADLCSNNIRVNKINKSDPNQIIKVLGIIDFADGISGDGLYDLGRILSHVYGDWRFIEAMESGYFKQDPNIKQFTKTQYKQIIFYALSFCVWLLDISSEDSDFKKYNKILSNLILLIKKYK
ncbi:hypothetical protein DICPUDRAFT_43687 [Dictyostelium purpureum]|uniref:Aminoglycoside phosphotransferase domain-containing protein n=1 Tax=Dictyostelium purpureum TaxID=5786 RepID=F1A4L6_DICPU|nr:uncharacterized protein DICPUDRAFT_43687 [Dictyostelium purpureum]EGC28866.1 hypothetical protein DICPUDRAFT_43687 [Dictyostelium purpureum]|eukprot:XP_003294613.1 hypothetical protein DICPUDRAFT_43687 [Dictyostelium purpureum]